MAKQTPKEKKANPDLFHSLDPGRQWKPRKSYNIEIDPIYCQIIINRMLAKFPDLVVKINGGIYGKK